MTYETLKQVQGDKTRVYTTSSYVGDFDEYVSLNSCRVNSHSAASTLNCHSGLSGIKEEYDSRRCGNDNSTLRHNKVDMTLCNSGGCLSIAAGDRTETRCV